MCIRDSFESGNLNNWSIEDSISVVQGQGYNASYGAQINGWGRMTQIVATSAGEKYNVTGWLRINRQMRAPKMCIRDRHEIALVIGHTTPIQLAITLTRLKRR